MSKKRNESIMEATLMNLVGFISTAVLSLTLVAAAPMYAQEQHGQDEQKANPEEKNAQPEKSAKQEQKPAAQQEKNTKQEEKNAQQQDKNTKQEEKSAQQQHTPQAKPEQQAQRASANRGGRIPDDRFKASFGEQHRFRVSHADYDNHRFQYGGYSFGFVDPWPSNWLYTQDVFVIEIDGVYYLCNASFPGVNLVLSFTL
jgi:phage repressor protein C with HTH and peptisase S24 domain